MVAVPLSVGSEEVVFISYSAPTEPDGAPQVIVAELEVMVLAARLVTALQPLADVVANGTVTHPDALPTAQLSYTCA